MSRAGGGAAARGLGLAGLRALSLEERRSLVDRCAVGVAASPFDENEAARVDGLLARWRSQSPFDREDGEIWWRRRLEAEGLSEEELRKLLARSHESLADSPVAASLGSDGGDWVDAVERSLAGPSPEPVPWPRAADPPHRPDSGPFALLRIVEPLVADARRRLADGIEALASDLPSPPPFEPRRALELLFEGLPPRLTALLGRTLVMELQVARLEERLVGDTPEERFASFVREQSRPDALRDLLTRYPVLARRLVTVLVAWVETGLEFLRHLAEDAQRLSRTFAGDGEEGRALGMLTEFQTGAGDRHRGGRTVIRVRFETPDGAGLRLVYKPRSLVGEVRFQELLSWLGRHGLSTPFRTLEVLDRGDHGWVEHVETRPCASEAEVERFFHRQGAYLALLDLLQATDFHHENLIAVGEHPVLVDLETLFHPWVEAREIRQPERSYGHALRDTVLRVGLLPQRVWGDRERAGVDLSGLGAAEGQVLPKGLQIEHGDTDRMRFSPGRAKLPPPASRPRLDGSDVELVEHAGALEAGFREVLDLCRRHRDDLTAADGPLEAFHDAEVRVVFRPTRGYALLLLEATHPHVQGDGLELDRLLDRLWSGVPDRPFLEALIPCERRDLWRGDVPRFTTRPGSRDLVASDGERVEGFFDEPALGRVKRRLEKRLTEGEIRRQSWILEGSLQAVRLERRELERPSYDFREASRPPTREALLAASRKAATRLAELALTGSEEVHWLAVQATAADTWSLAPATPDLYLGLPGIALFLGFLGVLDPERRHRDRWTGLARKTLETQRRQIDEAPESVPGIGGYNGWGGVVYGLVRLAEVWEDADLLDQAEEIAERHVAPAIPEDEHLDLMAGSAGCLSALLALARARPRSVALDLARDCGERLLDMAVPQGPGIGWPMRLAGSRALAGLSHGAAGIALALLRLAAATGERRFRDAALEALAFERSLYSPEHRNWPDLRQGADPSADPSGNPPAGSSPGVTEEQLHGEERFMCAWCHGAAGVGLARVAGLPHLDTAEVRDEIAAAVGTTLESGFGRNHSLCHGDLGNLLFLQRVARALDDRELEGRMGRCAGGVLAGIEEHGFLPGLARGTEPPGLMVGLAGMGWALLRLAEPQRVPDVLTLW